MTTSLISTLGLALCLAPAAVHGAELVSPMLARWVIRFVLPFFGPGVPSAAAALTFHEQLAMLDAARDAGPRGKERAAEDYVFLMLFEQRQGALAFLAVAVGVVYGMGLPLEARAPLHLVFGVMAALFALVNANHAGGALPRSPPPGVGPRQERRHRVRRVLVGGGGAQRPRVPRRLRMNGVPAPARRMARRPLLVAIATFGFVAAPLPAAVAQVDAPSAAMRGDGHAFVCADEGLGLSIVDVL